jgi:acyl transferase domain-containing protein
MASRLKSTRDEKLGDFCFSANAGRGHFTHRLAVAGTTVGEIREQLEQFDRGLSELPARTAELKPGSRLLLAFVFAEAKVAPDTGRALFEIHAQFRQALELCDRLLQPHLEHHLLEVLYGTSGDARTALLAQPSYGHAAVLSLQYALHGLWRAWGLEPTAVYGAGAGEYAAAAASGVLSWEQAVVLAARRGLVLEGLSEGASRSVTVRQLKDELATIDYLTPGVPFVSASLGRAFEQSEVPDQTHFGRHIYHVPKPNDAREALLAEGCNAYLELGPARVFAPADRVASETSLPSLDAPCDDWRSLLDTLAVLYTRGADIDWRAFDAPYRRRKLSLPTYPFQRQRHWLDFPDRNLEPAAPVVIERPSSHPLISRVRIHPPARSGFARKTEDDSGEGSSGQGGGA